MIKRDAPQREPDFVDKFGQRFWFDEMVADHIHRHDNSSLGVMNLYMQENPPALYSWGGSFISFDAMKAYEKWLVGKQFEKAILE